MTTEDSQRRGQTVRTEIFGEKAVQARMSAMGAFGAPLQGIINGFAYGDIWTRPGLDRRARSLAVMAMNAALNRPAEFRVHVEGALNNGCTPEEIREICLMVAVYAGIPAANDAHRIAFEVITARGLAVRD